MCCQTVSPDTTRSLSNTRVKRSSPGSWRTLPPAPAGRRTVLPPAANERSRDVVALLVSPCITPVVSIEPHALDLSSAWRCAPVCLPISFLSCAWRTLRLYSPEERLGRGAGSAHALAETGDNPGALRGKLRRGQANVGFNSPRGETGALRIVHALLLLTAPFLAQVELVRYLTREGVRRHWQGVLYDHGGVTRRLGGNGVAVEMCGRFELVYQLPHVNLERRWPVPSLCSPRPAVIPQDHEDMLRLDVCHTRGVANGCSSRGPSD